MDPNNFTCTYSQAAHAYMWGHVTTHTDEWGYAMSALKFSFQDIPKGEVQSKYFNHSHKRKISGTSGMPNDCNIRWGTLTGTLLLSNFQWGTLIWYLLFDNFRRGTFNWYLDFFFSNFPTWLVKKMSAAFIAMECLTFPHQGIWARLISFECKVWRTVIG